MALQIITWLLFFSLLYLLITSIIFLRNRIELTSLYAESSLDNQLRVSVCIPARNEEGSIRNLLQSLKDQDWPNYEVLVMDDQSTDQTFEIAESFQEKYPRKFFVYKGKEKPANWLGKPWACHQLFHKSTGEILLFLDADTQIQPGTLRKIVASFDHYNLDMLTVWPRQKLVTFWEQTIIPVVYYTLLSVLPAIYVYRNPKWMPSFLRKKMNTKFTAACGQCLAFRRHAYETIGGHESVKNQVIEDVELAKRIKKEGFVLRMFDGIGTVSCRMYHNENEIFEGFRKNFLLGFNNSIFVFILMGVLHLIVFVLPFITILISLLTFNRTIFFLSVASIVLILMQRLILAIWFKMNPLFSFTHPIAVLWFEWLAIVKIRDYFGGTSTNWKGRKV
ncbi:glycosyltransferase [Rhodohalobacter sp. 614A]|uniref:glycosyltransferase n=1 Tax=Rhodohalobacter sp. 614A TaxID=2908649 RepID=UPI001F301E59|nr:glycosyltransferase family 2 protein [Rhodohalobacter sp. 614A]